MMQESVQRNRSYTKLVKVSEMNHNCNWKVKVLGLMNHNCSLSLMPAPVLRYSSMPQDRMCNLRLLLVEESWPGVVLWRSNRSMRRIEMCFLLLATGYELLLLLDDGQQSD